MKLTLRIETKDGNVDFNFNTLKAYHYEIQKDESIAFAVYPSEGGRYLFDNDESPRIRLVEEYDE